MSENPAKGHKNVSKCGSPNGAQGEFQTASLTLKFGTDQLDHFGFDILEGFWKIPTPTYQTYPELLREMY